MENKIHCVRICKDIGIGILRITLHVFLQTFTLFPSRIGDGNCKEFRDKTQNITRRAGEYAGKNAYSSRKRKTK